MKEKKIDWNKVDPDDKSLFPFRDKKRAKELEIKVVKNFFKPDEFEFLKKRVAKLEVISSVKGMYDKLFDRYFWGSDPQIMELHKKITGRFQEHVQAPIKPSYHYISMYEKGKGICPIHTDRIQCEYTIDLCLNQKKIWPLYVEGQEYRMEKGDAIMYSGVHHIHWRDRIQPDNFCNLVFFHFVDKEFSGSLD